MKTGSLLAFSALLSVFSSLLPASALAAEAPSFTKIDPPELVAATTVELRYKADQPVTASVTVCPDRADREIPAVCRSKMQARFARSSALLFPNLESSTPYTARIVLVNKFGQSVATEQTFTTKEPVRPSLISAREVELLSPTAVKLSFETDQPTERYIVLCEGSDTERRDRCQWQLSRSRSRSHEIVFDELKPRTTYSYAAVLTNKLDKTVVIKDRLETGSVE